MRRARRDKGDAIWYSEVKARVGIGGRRWGEILLVVGVTVWLTVLGLWALGLTRFEGVGLGGWQ
jgi:hypothetical protein